MIISIINMVNGKWHVLALFRTLIRHPKHFYVVLPFTPFSHIHSVVVSYFCSHSCPGADWWRGGLPYTQHQRPSLTTTKHTTITHLHALLLCDVSWPRTKQGGSGNQTAKLPVIGWIDLLSHCAPAWGKICLLHINFCQNRNLSELEANEDHMNG